MAFIASFASSKGGPGKSTLTSLTAMALAERGVSVTVLDADPSGRATQISRNNANALGAIYKTVPGITVDTMAEAIRAEFDKDVILIDPEGVDTTMTPAIAGCADLVVVPTRLSQADVTEAFRTAKTVMSSATKGKEPTVRIVLNQVPGGQGRAIPNYMRAIEEVLRESPIEVMKTRVHNRIAYVEALDEGRTLKGLGRSRRKARLEIEALVDELLETLETHYNSKMELAA